MPCVSLLSTPLQTSLPGSFPLLLERSINRAINEISTDSMRIVHKLLSALESPSLDCLSYELVARLQDRILQHLQVFEPENNLIHLLCLAVLARLSRPTGFNGAQHSMQAAQSFFTSQRAQKTLDLVVLSVIYISSKSSTLTAKSDLEALQLSFEITDTIQLQSRRLWISKDMSKAKKLYEKATRNELDAEVRCAAFDVICSLLGDIAIPPDIVKSFEVHLQARHTASLKASTMSKMLMQTSGLVIKRTIQGSLRLLSAADQDNSLCLEDLDGAVHFIDALMLTGQDKVTALYDAVLPQPPEDTYTDQLHQFVSFSGVTTVPETIQEYRICPVVLSEARIKLFARAKILFLKSTLRASKRQRSTYASLLDQLVDNQGFQEQPKARCACYKTCQKNLSAPSIFEAECTPGNSTNSHN